jgi:iron complex outermembrane receptor protein
MEFYALVDNLTNVKYSLGNDLNAFGGRYYNPSPSRNLLIGCKVDIW